MKKVLFVARDQTKLVGDYYASEGSKGALLLHMMPATRESWREFAPLLVERGYQVLAIDLRGHGESAGGPDGYKDFSEEEHQESIQDVEAGVTFLEGQGVNMEELVLMGASVGANLALWYAAEHAEIPHVVLLSAGLSYEGIETESLVGQLEAGQRVFLASSLDDEGSEGNNADMNRTLHELIPTGVDKYIRVYRAAGHGTDMFGKENPRLEDDILRWLR